MTPIYQCDQNCDSWDTMAWPALKPCNCYNAEITSLRSQLSEAQSAEKEAVKSLMAHREALSEAEKARDYNGKTACELFDEAKRAQIAERAAESRLATLRADTLRQMIATIDTDILERFDCGDDDDSYSKGQYSAAVYIRDELAASLTPPTTKETKV